MNSCLDQAADLSILAKQDLVLHRLEPDLEQAQDLLNLLLDRFLLQSDQLQDLLVLQLLDLNQELSLLLVHSLPQDLDHQ